ncbi:MAG: 2-dehydro-3-deoxygalactonokinase [Povalibacter sp.]
MASGAFIAGDWGTTNLRLTLCDANGAAIDHAQGPGASQVQGRFDTAFADLTARWTKQFGPLPAVLCGMVGSTIGWTNVPYLPCPTRAQQIAYSMTAIAGTRVRIAPGLSCRNRHGAPDVLRGEETQILGAIALEPSLGTGEHLLCLPGTHTKWVVLDDGVITEFLTSASGELFSIVNQHSVLIRSDGQPAQDSTASFDQAVDHVKAFPQSPLAHLIFECRSRQIAGELSRAAAPHFLSGLLIGQDVLNAVQLFADVLKQDRTIVVVGTDQLIDLHARAFSKVDYSTRAIDGSAASLAGLTALHQHVQQKERNDAA